MFRLDDKLKVYVHRDAVDFRKSINGLAAIVEQQWSSTSMGLRRSRNGLFHHG
jgi:hypothetical protein